MHVLFCSVEGRSLNKQQRHQHAACPQGQLYKGRRQLGLARRAGADSCPWLLLCCCPLAMVTRHPLQLNMALPTSLLPCCFHTGERPLWLVPSAAGRKANCCGNSRPSKTHTQYTTPTQPQPTQPPQQQHAPPAQTTPTRIQHAPGRAAAATAQAACTRACIGRVSSRCVRERSTLRAPTSNCSDVWLRSRFGAIRSKLLCRS